MNGVALSHNARVGAMPRAVRSPIRPSRLMVRASDDEDMVPIISGHKKKEFTKRDLEKLAHPSFSLGGATIGEELARIRSRYVEAESAMEAEVTQRLSSPQWDGDVYIGSRWNTLSVIYLIFLVSTAGTGLFAWLSYGHLWGITPGLY